MPPVMISSEPAQHFCSKKKLIKTSSDSAAWKPHHELSRRQPCAGKRKRKAVLKMHFSALGKSVFQEEQKNVVI